MTQKRVLSIWGLALVLAVGIGSCNKQEDGAQAPRYLTIGPRYPKGWSKQFIAADFAQAIDRLARTGELDAAAPFVTAALTSLRLFLATQRAFATPALTFLGQAETTLERSIARWMEMSLK